LFEIRLQRALKAVVFLLFVFGSQLAAGGAAAPSLDHVYPVAIQAGTSNSMQVLGKFDPWPPKIWTDTPGVHFTAETNSGKLHVMVENNAPAGPHLVRLYNEKGTSEPRIFIIAKEPQIREKEPNDHFAKAQIITNLPAHLNGRLDKSGDVDCYSFHLDKGQSLIASVEAFVLMSPIDAVLRVVNTNGLELAFNHDDGRTLDPFLTWRAEEPGTYVVQVFGFAHPAGSDIKFTGGNNCIYRLHLSNGPYLNYALPLGLQRNTNNILKIIGWNLDSETQKELAVSSSDLGKTLTEKRITVPGLGGEITLPINNSPEIFESDRESNQVRHLALPFAVTGCISRPGEIDRYEFSAQRGDRVRLQLRSACFGFPLDAWLSVEDSKGKELTRNDDAGGNRDPVLDWTVTNGTSFAVSVGNVLHRGGPEYLYHLAVEQPAPDWKASLPSSSFAIEPGKTNEIKIGIKRLYGFSEKLKLDVTGLPNGITFSADEVSGKTSEVVLKLSSATNAPPASAPFQIRLKAGNAEKPVWNNFAATSVENGVPTGFNKLGIDGTDQLWLTVLPKADPEEKDEKPEKSK
jgi:hypothetical protein